MRFAVRCGLITLRGGTVADFDIERVLDGVLRTDTALYGGAHGGVVDHHVVLCLDAFQVPLFILLGWESLWFSLVRFKFDADGLFWAASYFLQLCLRFRWRLLLHLHCTDTMLRRLLHGYIQLLLFRAVATLRQILVLLDLLLLAFGLVADCRGGGCFLLSHFFHSSLLLFKFLALGIH